MRRCEQKRREKRSNGKIAHWRKGNFRKGNWGKILCLLELKHQFTPFAESSIYTALFPMVSEMMEHRLYNLLLRYMQIVTSVLDGADKSATFTKNRLLVFLIDD